METKQFPLIDVLTILANERLDQHMPNVAEVMQHILRDDAPIGDLQAIDHYVGTNQNVTDQFLRETLPWAKDFKYDFNPSGNRRDERSQQIRTHIAEVIGPRLAEQAGSGVSRGYGGIFMVEVGQVPLVEQAVAGQTHDEGTSFAAKFGARDGWTPGM